MDGESHHVEIQSSNDEVRVYLLDQMKQETKNLEPIVKVPLKITDYVKLDNGTAYLGFTQETFYLVNVAVIENWNFMSDAKSNQQDAWIGLTLDYRSHWPLHLIFSPDIIEKYNTLFSFLLPIKRV
mmetsp:Transcript_34530/g.33721  ORF Transcript_34530/g.33721 Transcript_34530/m.33721 type:complete len:126 (+) Transcript_34530:517-894(+)